MGGRGSTRLAVKYPELFCSLFNQAGNVPRTAEMGTLLGDEPGWDENQTETFLQGYLLRGDMCHRKPPVIALSLGLLGVNIPRGQVFGAGP